MTQKDVDQSEAGRERDEADPRRFDTREWSLDEMLSSERSDVAEEDPGGEPSSTAVEPNPVPDEAWSLPGAKPRSRPATDGSGGLARKRSSAEPESPRNQDQPASPVSDEVLDALDRREPGSPASHSPPMQSAHAAAQGGPLAELLEVRETVIQAGHEASEARDRAVEEASKAHTAEQMVSQTADQVKRFAEQWAEARDSVSELESEVRWISREFEQDLKTVRESLADAESVANAARAAAERSGELEEAMQAKVVEAETRAGKTAEEAARKEIEGGLSRIADMAATEAIERQHRRAEAAESKRASRASEQHERVQAAITSLQKRLDSIEAADAESAVASLKATLQRTERELGTTVVAMEKRLDDSVSEQAPLTSSLEHLRSMVEGANAEHSRRLDELEQGHADEIDSLKARLEDAEKTVGTLAARRKTALGAAKPASGATATGAISVNDATFEDLRALEFSVTQAARILARRDALEGFTSLDQLEELPGIPASLLERLKSRISL